MGSLSIWHWLVVLVIVALVFGTKRLRNIGGDVGEAIKSFRKGMQDGDEPPSQLKADEPPPVAPAPPPSADPDNTTRSGHGD